MAERVSSAAHPSVIGAIVSKGREAGRTERTDPLAHQIEHFGAVIRGEAKPLVSGRDGLQNLRVTDAIVEAAKTGKVVNVRND
jgi:predicted dehydrogenase